MKLGEQEAGGRRTQTKRDSWLSSRGAEHLYQSSRVPSGLGVWGLELELVPQKKEAFQDWSKQALERRDPKSAWLSWAL